MNQTGNPTTDMLIDTVKMGVTDPTCLIGFGIIFLFVFVMALLGGAHEEYVRQRDASRNAFLAFLTALTYGLGNLNRRKDD